MGEGGGGGGEEGGNLIARKNYIMLESGSCTYALESQLKQKRSQFSRLVKLLSFRLLEPPRETKIAFKNQRVREIGS